MSIRVFDSPVVRYGATLYPFPLPLTSFPDLTAGAAFVLFANPWYGVPCILPLPCCKPRLG